MSSQYPQYPSPDPYDPHERGRPLDYRTPPPRESAGRSVLRVLFWIVVVIVVGFLLLFGTCLLMMTHR